MPDDPMEAARLAGWTEPQPPPETHTMPPAIDPALGNNGVPAPKPGDPDFRGA